MLELLLLISVVLALLALIIFSSPPKELPAAMPRPPKVVPPIPPPVVQNQKWYYLGKDGDSYGPVLVSELALLFEGGEIHSRSLVLEENGTAWLSLGTQFVLPRKQSILPLLKTKKYYYSRNYSGREWMLRLV